MCIISPTYTWAIFCLQHFRMQMRALCKFLSTEQVTSETDVAAGIDHVANKWGKLDCVVNCAGVGIAVATYAPGKGFSHPQAEFDRVLRVCLDFS